MKRRPQESVHSAGSRRALLSKSDQRGVVGEGHACGGKPAGLPPAHSRHPVLRFVVLFSIFAAGFEGLFIVPIVRGRFFPAYMRLDAQAGAAILRALGHDARAADIQIVSSRFAIQLQRGCDAIEPSAVLIAGILAFPSAWLAKLPAVLLGTLALVLLNFVRIVSLFLVGVYFPKLFAVAHVEVWQAVFILFALILWSAWALRVSRPRAAQHAPVSSPRP
ncbi:MAG TPA: exosortase H [Phycisphaerae bacterium]|jgi:exosortase H (IPTLxxWG-CTERM-specific)